jgi:TolA-binding protein
MLKDKMRFIMAAAVTLLWALPMAPAETWHLEGGQNWQAVSDKDKDKYLLAVAEIKKLVSMGQSEAVRNALVKLKKDFPEIAGADLDAFLKAEVLLSEGKFSKASRCYDKFLAEYPESELYEAALDRQFGIGTAFLTGQKRSVLGIFRMKGYATGEKIMEKISDRAGNAPVGITAAVAIAESLEKRGKFEEAYHKWSEISSRWPSGKIGKDALLAMARCKHAAYKGPKYDASNLISAKSYYENFILRYPDAASEIGIDKKPKQINEQLADKQLNIGKYYERTGNKEAANLYYQMVVDNWPESAAAKAARKAMIKDSGIAEIKK